MANSAAVVPPCQRHLLPACLPACPPSQRQSGLLFLDLLVTDCTPCSTAIAWCTNDAVEPSTMHCEADARV